jgi:hypothetical protein
LLIGTPIFCGPHRAYCWVQTRVHRQVEHLNFRARGLGTVVVSEVIRLALLENNLLENKVLLYQTLESNIGAVRLAQKLGYRQYASHLAVRLTANVS